jgi:hypothetical protein
MVQRPQSVKDSRDDEEDAVLPTGGSKTPPSRSGMNKKPATPMDAAIQRRMAKNSSSSTSSTSDQNTDIVNKRKQVGY